MKCLIAAATGFLSLAWCATTAPAQDRSWKVTLSDLSSFDSLSLQSVDRESLHVLKNDTVKTFPLNTIAEIRRVKRVDAASYLLIGGFAGIPIGFVARATDASARVGEGNPLLDFGEGVAIGLTSGALLAWLSSQDEVYTFSDDRDVLKQYFLRRIIEDEEKNALVQQREDSIRFQEESQAPRRWFSVDYGVGIFNGIGRGWAPLSSWRIGFGIGPSQQMSFCAHLEYTLNGLAREDGMFSRLTPGNAKRHDVAFYGGFVMLKLVEVGAGIYYRTSNQVYNTYFFSSYPPTPWEGSGTSDFRFLYVIGLGYQIPIAYGVMMPVGLYFRNSTAGDNGSPVLFRIGLGYRL